MTWEFPRVSQRTVQSAAFLLIGFLLAPLHSLSQSTPKPKTEFLVTQDAPGYRGGRLIISLRSEPKTLNPLIAADVTTREVIGVMQADLVHINRASQITEPALAKSWKVSKDGLEYSIELRPGLQFSDGQPLDADDVLFTFRVYWDEAVHAPQRDLLIVGGQPIEVHK